MIGKGRDCVYSAYIGDNTSDNSDYSHYSEGPQMRLASRPFSIQDAYRPPDEMVVYYFHISK